MRLIGLSRVCCVCRWEIQSSTTQERMWCVCGVYIDGWAAGKKCLVETSRKHTHTRTHTHTHVLNVGDDQLIPANEHFSRKPTASVCVGVSHWQKLLFWCIKKKKKKKGSIFVFRHKKNFIHLRHRSFS